jgi:1-acyl-sn-glycerol-3-phosphate acyltransferase
VHGLSSRARELLDIRVAPDASSEAATAMYRDGPLLFFSRHAGPGDTVLLIDLVMTTYDRLPSVVFKESLALDPSIDLLGHRLPHAALNTADPDDCQRRIREVSSMLGPRGVLVLFPEGGNLTAQRRHASIAKLWRKGRRREASAGEDMKHVLPPHPAGALAALQGDPDCDVIFSAHTGLGLAAFPRELWDDTPIGRTLTTRMWRVPAAERPHDPDEQVRWLYDWWGQLDEWLEAQGEPRP